MSCSIVRSPEQGMIEQVLAPNQAPSLLYQNLLTLSYKNDLSTDPYVQMALGKGMIRDTSAPEVALALWSKVYSTGFEEWFGDWQEKGFTGLLDANGEPEIHVDNQGSFWKYQDADRYTLQQIPEDLHYVLPKNLSPVQTSLSLEGTLIAKSRYAQIARQLKEEYPGFQLLASESPDGMVRINKLLPHHSSEDREFMQALLFRLQSIFPEIQTRIISEDQLQNFDFGSSVPKYSQINSFIQQNTVYLVEGRATADKAIEEFLHPFVHSLQQENVDLFNNLLSYAQQQETTQTEEITRIYHDGAGFTSDDRNNELVTRLLTRGLKEKIIENPTPANYTLSKLIQQFLDYLKALLRQITGRDHLYVGELPSNLTVRSLLALLEEGNVSTSGLLNRKTYFNLSDSRLQVYNHVLSSANDVQREIIEKLALNNAIFYEDVHKYVHADTGEEFHSVTKLIKGVIDENDNYAINRTFGKEFDYIMNAVALGTSLQDIKQQLKVVKPGVIDEFYQYFSIFLAGIRSNGAVVIPQMVLADEHSMVAGTLDLLLIDPDGNLDIVDLKISKNSVLGRSYDKEWPVTSDVSVFHGQSMTTRAQHGIQQHAYKKLVELQKLEVRSVKTLHFLIQISKQQVIGFKAEGFVDHSTTNYTEKVDAIIPTPLPSSPYYTTLLQAQAMPENAPVVDRIADVVEQFKKRLIDRKTYFENINQSTKGKTTASGEYLEELAATINQIDEESVKGSPVGAFYQIFRFIHRDLKRKTDQINNASIPKEKLMDFLLETEKDILSYLEILSVPKLHLNNATLTKLAKEGLDFIDSLQTVIDIEIKSYVRDFVSNNSSRDFTEEELTQLLAEAKDISRADYLLGDLATSTDTLIANLDKVYKRKLQQIYDETDMLARDMVQLGNRLASLNGGKASYDFMLKRSKDGKKTGYYLTRIGEKYWNKLQVLKEQTQDEEGKPLKYKEIFNLHQATDEDLQYNIDLMHKKQAYRKFMESEYIDQNGQLKDGAYHRYTTEFKAVRDQFEFLYQENVNGTVVFSEWRKREGVTEADYKRYLAKYYSQEMAYLSPIKDPNGNNQYDYLGRVVERSDRFVKSEFSEPREISESGESMLDQQYENLMNPTSELGKIQKQFYENWVINYEKQIQKLPGDIQRMLNGRLPMIRDKFIGKIKKQSSGIVKGMLKGLRNLNPFELKVYSQQQLTNEHGEVENQIPVYYVGNFQSEKNISRLETEIKALGEQLRGKKITYDQYKERLHAAKRSLSIEKAKITVDELSTDMVTNLVEFSRMAENYKVMSAFESTVESVDRVIRERKYYRDSSTGKTTTNDGADSLVSKRLQKWMDMVFYRKNNPFQSQSGQIVRKIMQYMSLKNVALNPFGQVNNYLVGKMTNSIETFGSLHWTPRAMARSVKEYNSKYLPGLFAKRTTKLISKGDYYEIDQPYSKWEDMASLFRMMRKLQSDDLGAGMQDRILDAAYVMQESAEYNIQTKVGMAILMTRTLTHETTGEQLSIYDAHEFDRATGKRKIKPGYHLTDEQRHEITHLIHEVNKSLHGNYAYEDRMVIQEHLLGELAAQFHKWVYPAFTARVKEGYVDETRGETEGRHLSVWKFMKYLMDLRSMADSWDQLKPHQKKNLYKSSADLVFMLLAFGLYHLFFAIGSGIDEEDEVSRKLANWMTAQSDRLYDEVAIGVFIVGTQQQYQLLKSPIAMLGTAKDGMEVIYEALKTPFPPYDDLYFKKGVNRGELKLKKELMDIIPVMNLVNRWDSYETVKEFYIR